MADGAAPTGGGVPASSSTAASSSSAVSSLLSLTSSLPAWCLSPPVLLAAGATGLAGIGGLAIWWRRRRAQRRRRAEQARREEEAAARASPALATQTSASAVPASHGRTDRTPSFLNLPSPTRSHTRTPLSARTPFARGRPSPSPSPRLSEMRATPESQQLSEVLLRAKARKEAREERAASASAAAAARSATPASVRRNQCSESPLEEEEEEGVNDPAASSSSVTSTTDADIDIDTQQILSSQSSTSSSSSRALVRISPAPQTITLGALPTFLSSFPTFLSPAQLVALLLCLLLLMVMVPDAIWIAPVSPVLLYSLISVAHEPVSTDDSDDASSSSSSSSSAPRALLSDRFVSADAQPTQGLSLFGYSVQLPTPSRARRIRAATPSDAPLAPSAAPLTTASSRHGASSSSSSSHSSRVTSGSLRTPLAIPFPSLATPAARSLLLADRERAFTPETDSEAPSLSPPATRATLQHDDTRTTETVHGSEDGAVSSSSPSAAQSVAVSSRSAMRIETGESSSHLARDSPVVASIAASIAPRSPVPLPARATQDVYPITPTAATVTAATTTTPASLIDVSATLDRLAPHAHAHAVHAFAHTPSQQPLTLPLELSGSDVFSDSTSTPPTPASAAAAGGLTDDLSAADRDFFRDDAAASLPPSMVSSSSFSIRFTFHHSFDEVSRAFLRLGTRADDSSDEADQSSDNATTSATITPATSSNNLTAAQSSSSSSAMERRPSGSLSSGSGSAGSFFSLADLVVDTLSDTHATNEPGADIAHESTSSPVSAPSVRRLVRRVSTPIRLPALIRKLLGHLHRLVMEERVQVDNDAQLLRIQLTSKDMSGLLSVWSMQTLAPHPTNPSLTLWSCRYRLHVYASCGPMRQNVAVWVNSMAKSRQQQISSFLSARLKRQLHQQHQREEEERLAHAAAVAAAASPIRKRSGTTSKRADSNAKR